MKLPLMALLCLMLKAGLAVAARPPLVVQNLVADYVAGQVNFDLMNGASAEATAWRIKVITAFNDGHKGVSSRETDAYQDPKNTILPGQSRRLVAAMGTSNTVQVKGVDVQVTAVIFADNTAYGDPEGIVKLIAGRLADAKAIQHTIDRLTQAKNSSDPKETLAGLEDPVPPDSDHRAKVHYSDFHSIVQAVRQSPDGRTMIDVVLKEFQNRLSRASSAAQIRTVSQ
jgi:hypothetical protein